jgi:hypothetical protein
LLSRLIIRTRSRFQKKFSITGKVLESDEDGDTHGGLEIAPAKEAPATAKVTINAIPDNYAGGGGGMMSTVRRLKTPNSGI